MRDDTRKWMENNGLLYPRPEPLAKVVPYYEHDFSERPEQIRVSFSDGSTAIYDLRTDQPAPVIIENIKIIRKWKQGYVNQPARRRRRK
ncbi:MAG: hypothetical protein J6S83_03890 [Lachnospiraceae bacterium]|nr:hypothetical protein [Lachnospiraceae bacterium]